VPADMKHADKAEAVAAEMAVGLVLVGAYGISPGAAKYGVVSGEPAELTRMRGLGAVTLPPTLRRPVASGFRDAKPVEKLATNALFCQVSAPRLAARAPSSQSSASNLAVGASSQVPSSLAARRSPGGGCRAAHVERERDDRNAPRDRRRLW
jgi:hypothetical protein